MIDKAGLKKKYRETPIPMGIYQVRNKVNGKILIGAVKNIQARLNRHKMMLKIGCEDNPELANDYKLYGEENFAFETLDVLEPKEDPDYKYDDDLKELEALWIEKLQPFGDKGYNILK